MLGLRSGCIDILRSILPLPLPSHLGKLRNLGCITRWYGERDVCTNQSADPEPSIKLSVAACLPFRSLPNSVPSIASDSTATLIGLTTSRVSLSPSSSLSFLQFSYLMKYFDEIRREKKLGKGKARLKKRTGTFILTHDVCSRSLIKFWYQPRQQRFGKISFTCLKRSVPFSEILHFRG